MNYITPPRTDLIRSGDEYSYKGSDWARSTRVGQPQLGDHQYRRPVAAPQPGVWITDCPPTVEDGDAKGEVLAWEGHSIGSTIRSVHGCASAGLPWMHLPAPPKPQYVKVDGHDVIPQPDGSLKVGCQTVSSEDFEEISRQRSAVLGE